MKIYALRKAFFKGEIIRIGQIVEISGNKVPSWGKKVASEKDETPNQKPTDENKKVVDNENTTGEKDETPKSDEVAVDEFEGKSEEEILKILDELITKSLEKNILLENVENKTPIEQIKELRELLKEE
jgi:hypothetical protein